MFGFFNTYKELVCLSTGGCESFYWLKYRPRSWQMILGLRMCLSTFHDLISCFSSRRKGCQTPVGLYLVTLVSSLFPNTLHYRIFSAPAEFKGVWVKIRNGFSNLRRCLLFTWDSLLGTGSILFFLLQNLPTLHSNKAKVSGCSISCKCSSLFVAEWFSLFSNSTIPNINHLQRIQIFQVPLLWVWKLCGLKLRWVWCQAEVQKPQNVNPDSLTSWWGYQEKDHPVPVHPGIWGNSWMLKNESHGWVFKLSPLFWPFGSCCRWFMRLSSFFRDTP